VMKQIPAEGLEQNELSHVLVPPMGLEPESLGVSGTKVETRERKIGEGFQWT